MNTLKVLCAQLTRDLFAIAKYLYITAAHCKINCTLIKVCKRLRDGLAFFNGVHML